MRSHDKQHRFYCGIDLHARSMYLSLFTTASPASRNMGGVGGRGQVAPEAIPLSWCAGSLSLY